MKHMRNVTALLLVALMCFSGMGIYAQESEIDATEATESAALTEETATEENASEESEGGAELMSLLPVEEISAELDLSSYLPAELTNIKVSELMSRLTDENGEAVSVPSDATVVWSRFIDEAGEDFEDDVWQVTKMDETISIMPTWAYSDTVEIIVGTPNQLDTENVRYITDLILPETESTYIFDLYEQNTVTAEDGKTENVVRSRIPYEIDMGTVEHKMEDGGYKYTPCRFLSISSRFGEEQDYYMNMGLNTDIYPGYEISVYDGIFNSAEEAAAAAEAEPSIDITNAITGINMEETDAGYKAKWALWEEKKDLSIVFKKDGEAAAFDSFTLAVEPRENDVYVSGLYTTDENGDTIRAYADYDNEYINSKDHSSYIRSCTYMLKKQYPVDGEYRFRLEPYNGDTGDYDDFSFVTKSVVGHFNTLEAAEGAEDITGALFVTGYSANYSGKGVNFTVFSEDDIWKFTVKAVENTGGEQLSDDDSFSVRYMYKGDGEDKYSDRYDSYRIPSEHDSYYDNGYQTILINDSNADLSNLKPYGYFDEKAKVYQNGELEVINGDSGNILSAKDFTTVYSGDDRNQNPDGSLKYTVAAEDSVAQRNYWVTVAKKAEGAKLFVNGPDEREIFLDNYYGYNHDIFIANIGTESLTGLKVELDATNVKLDDYWTVGGEGNDTLAPFETTDADVDWESSAELFNVGKIRLIPDGEGEIKGTLTVSADGQEPRVIKLKGHAGNPKIDTETLKEAVKYVPYQSIVTTNNMYSWNKVTFSLAGGKLPEGVELLPSGEIYGVPKAKAGSFPIKVRAKFSAHEFSDSIASFTLVLNDNTDENVDAQTDEGYEIIKRVPTITTAEDQVFEFEYDYAEHKDEFQGFWLDGEKLEEGVDYTVDAGSTKITIASQTIKNAGTGKHTIAAEYRTTSTNEVKKSTQNYTSKKKSSGGGGTTKYAVVFDTNGGKKISTIYVKKGSILTQLPIPQKDGSVFAGWYADKACSVKYNDKATVTTGITLYAKWNQEIIFNTNGGNAIDNKQFEYDSVTGELPVPTRTGYEFAGWYTDEALTKEYDPKGTASASFTVYAKWKKTFTDLDKTAWYYESVKWAFDNGLMNGLNDDIFAPNNTITGGMVVTVLARIANVDVEQYAELKFDDVYENEWYTPYANWAKSVGLVDGIPFNPPTEIAREEMGVIIARFLEYMNVEMPEVKNELNFDDIDEVDEDAAESLEMLVKLGVLEGRGENKLAPKALTTRAEFATLAQRIFNIVSK